MGLSEKIINALQRPLEAEYIRLDDEDGISGFVVSRRFEQLSSLDRQQLIDKALRKASEPLSNEELRHILMIAGLTPTEYESVGARIRVHDIRELDDGSLEVLVQGACSDAEYVRNLLNNQTDIQTTEPELSSNGNGTLMRFRAKRTAAEPLTKEKVIGVLNADESIEIMQNV